MAKIKYPARYFNFIDTLTGKQWSQLAGQESTVRSQAERGYRIDCQERNIRDKFGDGLSYVQFAIQPEAGKSSSYDPEEKELHAMMGGMSLSTVLVSEDWLKPLGDDESRQQTLIDVWKHSDVRVQSITAVDTYKRNMGLIDHTGRQYAKMIESVDDKVGVFVDLTWLDQVEKEAKAGQREKTEKWKAMKKNVRDKRKVTKQGELLVAASGEVLTAPPR